jgi:hypothetical protein
VSSDRLRDERVKIRDPDAHESVSGFPTSARWHRPLSAKDDATACTKQTTKLGSVVVIISGIRQSILVTQDGSSVRATASEYLLAVLWTEERCAGGDAAFHIDAVILRGEISSESCCLPPNNGVDGCNYTSPPTNRKRFAPNVP